ncbi:MAG: hypothetical protein ACK4RK_01955 [Gemmataceae bacterium]
MARKVRQPQGDSKVGLIVSLVTFVLLSIVLSVIAYYGYTEQDTLRRSLDEVRKQAELRSNERDKEVLQKLILRGPLGLAKDTDIQDLAGLKNRFAEDYLRTVQEINNDKAGVTWNADEDKVSATYPERIAKLENDLQNETKRRTQLEQDLEAKNKELEDERAKFMAADEVFKGELKKLQGLLAMVKDQKTDALKKALDTNSVLQNDNELKQTQFGELNDNMNRTIAQKDKEIRELRAQVQAMKARQKLPDLTQFDQPRGQIVSVDRSGQTVTINLGSNDRVKENLTFSIFPRGTLRSEGLERKGSLQVVQVLNGNLSKAMVTEGPISLKDPILPGDELFNLTWNSTLRDRIAIAGRVDLTGEGIDDTDEFMRNLREQGVIIDAYLDRDNTVKGPGISIHTNYLIITELGNPDKIAMMRQKADELGVTPVSLYRYLTLIGYPLPKRTIHADWNSYQRRPDVPLERRFGPAPAPVPGAGMMEGR